MLTLSKLLLCPNCRKSGLEEKSSNYKCSYCSSYYPIKDNILILIRPEYQKEILKKWNEKGEYESLHKKRLKYDKKKLATSPRIAKLVKDNTSDDTLSLDVGCGSGLYTKYFKGSVVSFDIGPYFIRKISSKYKDENKVFIVADANDFPFQKKSFDFVFCSQVIEHLDKKSSDKLIKRMIGSSKNTVVIDTPNDSNSFLKILKKIIYKGKSHHKENYHLDHHQNITISDLKKHNLRIHSCVGFVTRRTIRLNVLWNIYDVFAWKFPNLGGNLIGIIKKK